MTESNDEDLLERSAEHLSQNRAAEGVAGKVDGLFGLRNNYSRIAEDLDREAAADRSMLTAADTAFHEQGPVEAAGIDLAAVVTVDPTFNDFNFRTLVRETFTKVRDARRTEHVAEGAPLLSATMLDELNHEIAGDVAAHRHHRLAMLEVEDVVIVSAGVVNGREQLGVHIIVAAEEMDRDENSQAIVAGDTVVRRWAELWTFERDPSVDTAQSDEQHILAFGEDEWIIAHLGWVVTGIRRLTESEAQPLPARPGIPTKVSES